MMFVKGYAPTYLEDISYHIHMGSIDDKKLRGRTCFRYYLNQHDKYRKEY